MSLTLEDALRAYAKALNTLNPAPLEPILAVDFHYSSQMVFQEITSRDTFLDYFRVKLQAIKKSRQQCLQRWEKCQSISDMSLV